jgi:hypothetical protein
MLTRRFAFSPRSTSAPAVHPVTSVQDKMGGRNRTRRGYRTYEACSFTRRHTTDENALKQTYLRGLMAEADERARKNPADVDSVNLVKSVVNLGLSQGWLSRKTLKGQSGTERIGTNMADLSDRGASNGCSGCEANEMPQPVGLERS